MNETDLPGFLTDTLASIRLRRRAGEWDVASRVLDGVQSGDAALDALLLAFPWARPTAIERSGDGVQAELDLRLAWQGPDGALGRSWWTRAGQFVFDPFDRLSTVTIWPNVFTDQIYLYRAVGLDFERDLARFDSAAADNRTALQHALPAWESLTGGQIVGVESELVDGIHPYGFADDATAR